MIVVGWSFSRGDFDVGRLALVPAALYLFFLSFAHTVSARLIALGVIGLAAGWMWWRHPRQRPPFPPWGAALGLWLGVALLSVAWAWDPGDALRQIKVEMGYGLTAFAAFHLLTRDEGTLRGFVWVMGGAAGLLFLSAVANILGGWAPLAGLFAKAGVVQFNSFLVVLFPLTLMLLAPGPGGLGGGTTRALMVGVFFLAVGFFVQQRIYWLILAAQFVTILVLGQWRWRWLTWQRGVLALTALVLCAGMLLLTVLVRPYGKELAQAGSWAEVVRHHQQDERFVIWAGASAQIRESPWVGKGFGRFGDYPFCTDKGGWREPCHAHNIFLDYLLQMGIPGLAALLLLLGVLARSFLGLCRSGERLREVLGICGLTLLVGVVVRNLTNDHFVQEASQLFWAAVGMLTGVGWRRPGGAETRPARDSGAGGGNDS